MLVVRRGLERYLRVLEHHRLLADAFQSFQDTREGPAAVLALPVPFKLSGLSAREVRFENPYHDFPQALGRPDPMRMLVAR